MMIYPAGLEPSTTERFLFADGHSADVPKTTPAFVSWHGPAPGSNFGSKALLSYKGRPAFAELAILWSFLDAGWKGAWIDSFGGRRLKDFWPVPMAQPVPEDRDRFIRGLSDAGARPWDVYCWSPSATIFVEAKRSKRDAIRFTQIEFLRRALAAGLNIESFPVVEWAVA